MSSMLFLFLCKMQETVVLIYIGSYGGDNGADLIAGFGSGTMITNVLFNSFAFGLNSALETLVS